MRLSILSLLLSLGCSSAGFAAEGYYRPEELGSARSLLELAQGAAVLFEGRGENGTYSPFANGFFISRAGHILTNHHVGTNCGGRNPPSDYGDLSRPREYEAGSGFLCRDFRARVYPGTSRERILRLEMIARPDQATLDGGGDFIILRATNFVPTQFVSIARTRNFPIGTPYFMVGYPPETSRGESSELIRRGVYTDVAVRGEYRIAYGEIVPKPDDYLNASNPVPYFVGNADGAPGTSGSLILSPSGNFLGYVQGAADRRGLPDSPLCLRDGIPAGMDRYYCGALINYLRASWVLEKMENLFPKTVSRILQASAKKTSARD